MRRDVASIVVDGGIGDWVGDDDLPGLCLELDGSHEVVSPRGERRVLSIRRFGVLSFCALPWPEASISKAGIAEVLPEVVDGRYAYLSRESVIDLLEDVVFCLFDEKLNVFCVHDKIFLVFVCCFGLKLYICSRPERV